MTRLKSFLLVVVSVVMAVMIVNQASPWIASYYHPQNFPSGPVSFHDFVKKEQVPPLDFDWKKLPEKFNPRWNDVAHSSDKDYEHLFTKNGEPEHVVLSDPNLHLHGHLVRKSTQEILFDGSVSTDAFGRRLTLPIPKNPTETLVLDGCSFTFGDAVSDDQTLASAVQKRMPDLHVLNLGFSGRSPASSLYVHREQGKDFLEDLQGGIGNVAYVFLDFQMSRLLPDSAWMQGREDAPEPVYRMEQGHLVFKGMTDTFYSGWRGFLFWGYTNSKFFNAFHSEAPVWSLEDKVQLASELILADLDQLAKRFDRARRILIIHPSSWNYNPSIIEYLQKRGVLIFDYSKYNLRDLLNGYSRLTEGHPSPLANDFIGALVAKDMNQVINSSH